LRPPSLASNRFRLYIQAMTQFEKARSLLLDGVAGRVYPGAVLAIGLQGRLAILPAGRLTYAADSAPVAAETIYDIASLTKVVATTAMAMILVDRGLLQVDLPAAGFLPDFVPPYDNSEDPLWSARGEVTVRHLLAHTSGLPAYEKFYVRARRREHVLEEAISLPLEEPPGAKTVYSDVGFILLGEILERLAQEPLDAFCQREIFGPLEMRSTCFNPPEGLRSRIAPTEQDDLFRKRLICGEVQDENAWVMGGVAGHAGLFSIAGDLASFSQMMLEEGRAGSRQLIRSQTIGEFTRAYAAQQGSARGLGWDKPGAPSSSGRHFSTASFGHLGYTGTSLWIDPEKQLFVVLLTNRIHPARANDAIRTLRPALHDSIVEELSRRG
jgi:CubicO group peptidase (beta-lactamase class C family)